jgi:hypothetical protein
LANGGATAPRRDAIDLRIVGDVQSGGGGDQFTKRCGGPAELREFGSFGLPISDSLPDAWEAEHGLDSSDAADQRWMPTATAIRISKNGSTRPIPAAPRARPLLKLMSDGHSCVNTLRASNHSPFARLCRSFLTLGGLLSNRTCRTSSQFLSLPALMMRDLSRLGSEPVSRRGV